MSEKEMEDVMKRISHFELDGVSFGNGIEKFKFHCTLDSNFQPDKFYITWLDGNVEEVEQIKTQQMKDLKFIIKSNAKRVSIEKEANRLGFYKFISKAKVNIKYLFLNTNDTSITYSNSEDEFNNSAHTETTLEELKSI